MIESLKWQLHNLEREKQFQNRHIQNLQEEVHCLHEGLVERQTEEMRIRRIKQVTSMDKLEDSFNSKLHREELNDLRREVEQLKTLLRRQETDLHLQQKEARETRRLYECSCKTLAELTECCRTHRDDLVKTLSQYSHTQQELHHIRTELSELKDEVRSLSSRGQEPTSLLSPTSAAPPLPVPHGHSRRFRADETDSDSEDFSPTLSLAEISSDDLSWLDDKEPAQRLRTHLSVQSKRSEFAVPGSDVEDRVDSDGDDLLDDVDNLESGSNLSLSDL
ncbi:uncharacterized protein LOC119408001 [Nematolebias whitei]|uniref:uncharacterized protein LOC119408001 n=1 Tax=Nematolebias whitei TaxID=451745 RepID=UPI00189C5850|nr:uncharacterized protein LOC119408001 [Nematolebias whitei]